MNSSAKEKSHYLISVHTSFQYIVRKTKLDQFLYKLGSYSKKNSNCSFDDFILILKENQFSVTAELFYIDTI